MNVVVGAVGDLDMFINDALRIGEIVRRDPSFRSVDTGLLSAAEENLLEAATPGAFCLDAMRLMALPGNGHTRAIANRTARVAPIRFVWLADGPTVSEGPYLGHRLMAVNGVDAAEVFSLMRPLLSGTVQRARALAGFMFAWPTAIALATGRQGPPTYRLQDEAGTVTELQLDETVRAEDLYPMRETGPTDQLFARRGFAIGAELETGVFHRKLGAGLSYVRIGDLASSSAESHARRLNAISEDLHGDRHIIMDLRGNPGGSFFGALGFAKSLPVVAAKATVAVLIDKFTFSAGIVTAALLKVHAGARLVGEEMGDSEQFYAEGTTEELSHSGLDIRYSDGWHDWFHGRADPALTPASIADELVAAGSLLPDISMGLSAADLQLGRDPALDRAITLMSA